MTFSPFDILTLSVFLISSLLGFYRGAIYIIINLISFVSSIISAIFLYSFICKFLSEYIDNDIINKIASASVSYIISLVFFTVISSKIVLLFCDKNKGFLDKFSGLILGILRGLLFVLTIFIFTAISTSGTYLGVKKTEDVILKLSSDKYPEWLGNSYVTPYLESFSKEIASSIPSSFWREVKLPDYLINDEKSENKISEEDIEKNGDIE